MSIQIDNGEFTRIHNDILDGLAKASLTAMEYRCVLFLVRMTYGWQKKEDAISLSQWAEGIGIDKNNRGNILNTLNGLVSQGVIYTRSNGNNRPATWGLVKAYFEKPTVMQPHNSLDDGPEPTVMPEDNSSVMQPHNSLAETVMQPHNHKRKVLKKEKKEGESAPARIASPREPASKELHYKSPHIDPRHFVNGFVPPGKGMTAVEVYYERFSINQDAARLNAIKEDDLAKLCPDLDKLREVVTAYSQTPFQLGNVRLILDWYSGGIPEKHKPPGSNGVYTNGAMSEEKKVALRTRAQLARKSLESATKFKTAINPQWQRDIDTAKAAGVI